MPGLTSKSWLHGVIMPLAMLLAALPMDLVSLAEPIAPAPPTSQSNTAANIPADLKEIERHYRETPDWTGPLSERLKIRAEADSWGELAAKLQPALTWGEGAGKTTIQCGFPNLLWIDTDPDGRTVFHLAQAFTWKPTGQKTRWVVADEANGPNDERAGEQIAGHSMPAEVRVVLQKPQGDHPVSYAIVKATHPTGGSVYEIGWEVPMSGGTGHYENLRLLYVWRDAGGKWRLTGEGPQETAGKAGGMECVADSTAARVAWLVAPARPVVSMVRTSWTCEVGEDSIGLPDVTICRAAVLDATGDPLPTTLQWSDQDYIAADAADTLDKIIYRLAVLGRDERGWNPYELKPDAQLLRKRAEITRELRQRLLTLNPKLAGTADQALPKGTPIVIAIQGN